MALTSTTDNGLCIITLDKSGDGNRLNPELLAALHDCLDAAENAGDVRVILLRSNGPEFCLGMDLAKLENDSTEGNEGNNAGREAAIAAYSSLLQRLQVFPLPVIALIRGPVKAGGVGLAAACDIVIASENAEWQLSEVLLGLTPANVIPFLVPWRLSMATARQLILTAETVRAEDALALGLADRLFPEERLERKLKGVLKMLFRAAPGALAYTKSFTANLANEKEAEKRYQMAQDALLELTETADVKHAVQAFQEGELPDWSISFKTQQKLVPEEQSDE